MTARWANVPLGQAMDHLLAKERRIMEIMGEIKAVLAGRSK